MAWGEAKTETLRRMWNEGASYGAIGREVCMSRCAVAGKVRRMDLPMRADRPQIATPSPPKQPLVKSSAPKEPELMREPFVVENSTPIPMLALDNQHCKYAVNDGLPEYLFCGQPCVGRYCPPHKRIVYQPERRRA